MEERGLYTFIAKNLLQKEVPMVGMVVVEVM
jgi:hypothetical protein